MNKYIAFVFFTVVFSMDTKAIECNGKLFDGEQEVPFTIYIFDQAGKAVSGARVRIRSRSGTVEGISNANGAAKLSPLLRTYGFLGTKSSKLEEPPKACRNYHGFNTHKEDYLIVQKEGFHTMHIILGMLKFESRFYNNEELKAELHFHLLSSEI